MVAFKGVLGNDHHMLRCFTLAVLLSFFAALAPSSAQANSKYAAIVVHSDTGDVLFARNADSYRYPASITKVMTLYLLFEKLEAGELKLNSKLKVSTRAAGQPPSKLGVKPGSTITVEDAIQALVVRSANDVAVVVAENLSGTEWQFAQVMTKKARKIGMRRTTFRNASGLPNRKQRSTARDLAILSQRMVQDFPQYYPYFNKRSFTYGGKTYRTHNKLLLTYNGADGLKTGYTRRSGFNLSTIATKSDHKLIGVVLGGRTAKTRDAHMKQILNQSYARIKNNPSVLKRVYAARPTPNLKPTLLAKLEAERANEAQLAALAFAETDRADAIMAGADPIGALIKQTGSAEDALAENQTIALLAGMALADSVLPVAQGDAAGEAEIAYAPQPENWSIQIGAYKSAELAASKLKRVARKAGGAFKTSGWAVAPYVKNGQTLYRARFTGFAEDEAQTACLRAKRLGFECFATAEDQAS
ncbi:MAG: D-alanyl-D-alanine carboxypeptidase [Pseudomonadota bacterium]